MVSWKAGFSPPLSHSWHLFSLTSLVQRLITLMFEDIRLVINCSLWYWIRQPVRFDKSAACVFSGLTCLIFLNLFFAYRKVGARPGHRPWRGRHRDSAEPGNPAGTFLEVSYNCAPSDLHQVQSFSFTQRSAGGLWAQEHTAYTHSGKEGPMS